MESSKKKGFNESILPGKGHDAASLLNLANPARLKLEEHGSTSYEAK